MIGVIIQEWGGGSKREAVVRERRAYYLEGKESTRPPYEPIDHVQTTNTCHMITHCAILPYFNNPNTRSYLTHTQFNPTSTSILATTIAHKSTEAVLFYGTNRIFLQSHVG